jgi:uncharacterized UBP type Zn finger protein
MFKSVIAANHPEFSSMRQQVILFDLDNYLLSMTFKTR